MQFSLINTNHTEVIILALYKIMILMGSGIFAGLTCNVRVTGA